MNQIAVASVEPSTALTRAEPDTLLAAIMQMARDPSVDVEKFDRLVGIQERLQERADARQSKREFDAAMNAVQLEMRPVFRDAENKEIRSRYATLEAIDAVARPVYLKHGFSLKFGTEAIDGPNIRITLDVKHTGGHFEHLYFDAPPDTLGPKGGAVKTVLHGLGSTDTYLRGRLLRGAFNIVLTNDPTDDDGNRTREDGEVITGPQAAEIRALIAVCSADPSAHAYNEHRALGKLGFDNLRSLNDLPANEFQRVRNALLTKKAVMAKRAQPKEGIAA